MLFRRFSKRRQRAALVVALIDRLEWGPPDITGYPIQAKQEGICSACGGIITPSVDRIVPAFVGPNKNVATYVHERCPSYWDLLRNTIEQYDDVIISKINNQGRGRASCGHDVENAPIYLVRQPISLQHDYHSAWVCEECVTPRSKEL